MDEKKVANIANQAVNQAGQETQIPPNPQPTTGYDPAKLKNADQAVPEFGDDSSLNNQVQNTGGADVKHTGEGVKTTALDPHTTIGTEKLQNEAGMIFGQEAEMYNSQNAGYIEKRNDAIASALYNEWKTTREDVANFLNNQAGFQNSSEEARNNTIESIWKRLWQTGAPPASPEETPQTPTNTPATVQGMGLMPTETELFGKLINNDSMVGIDPNSDAMQSAKSRVHELNRLNAMDASEIWSLLYNNKLLSGSQAMRDLQQFQPQKYQEVQAFMKQQDEVAKINRIAGTGTTTPEDIIWNAEEGINSYISDKLISSFGNNASEAGADFTEHLADSSTINNSRIKMQDVGGRISRIDQAISNLESDARQEMGADVPEYLIQSYVTNRSKRLSKERDALLIEYNTYKSDYEFAVEQEAMEWERNYKERQLALQEQKASSSGSGSGFTTSGYTSRDGMRTDRNNNPTAFTVGSLIANKTGLVEGVDYEVGDQFADGSNNYTARFLGDPVEVTIKAFDNMASQWIPVHSGRSYFVVYNPEKWTFWTTANRDVEAPNKITAEVWKWLTDGQKIQVVDAIYKREWGNGSLMQWWATNDDQLYTKFFQGKISASELKKQVQGGLTAEQVENEALKRYVSDVNADNVKEKIAGFMRYGSDLWVFKLTWGTEAERTAEQNRAKNSAVVSIANQISSKDISEQAKIWNAVGLSGESLAKVLAISLQGKYSSKNALKKALEDAGLYEAPWFKKNTDTLIWNIWNP